MRAQNLLVILAAAVVLPACLTGEDAGHSSDASERRVQNDPDRIDEVPLAVDDTAASGVKVKICHVPPGNPQNAHTITVSSSAVNAHLAHGDYLGRCETVPQVCTPGQTWQCYSGPSSTDSVGVCARGVKTCLPTGAGWSACVGEIVPGTEQCDGLDNDCDGTIDDNCVCVPGSSEACYSGPPGTNGVGICHGGSHVCEADGSGHGACVGEVLPTDEICGDGLDNNCSGHVDEGCLCPPGEEWQCYTGPTDTDSVGACHRGIKTCAADGRSYGACVGEQTPVDEVCGNGIDDDCDGAIDDGCNVCEPGSTIACYDGPAGTAGVGACAAGVRVCDGQGYGACVGSVGPAAEICGNAIDEDCDGIADDGCVCAPGTVTSCYDGPAGTGGVGTCAPGTRACNATGTGYGACIGSIGPADDVCGDGLDNDCDGAADDGCVCAPGSQASCYDGPAGTEGVGTCTGGVQTCDPSGSGYGACAGSVEPVDELCGDGLDNDCDGVADDRCVCLPGASEACYTGPAANAGVGACALGVRVCNPIGTGFDACLGSVLPAAELCGNATDDDCDGFTDEGCIGDKAWNDRDRDGLQEAGEAPLAGATFILRTESGAVVQIVVSDATGAYWFSNVPMGSYYIEEIAPVGFSPTPVNRGTDDGLDSDFDDEEMRTPTFGFPANGSIDHIDAGFALNIQS